MHNIDKRMPIVYANTICSANDFIPLLSHIIVLNTPAAMQIRYLESMASMARHSGQKTIFMPTTDDARTHFHPAGTAPAGTSGDTGSGTGFNMPSVQIAGSSGVQTLKY